MLAFLFSSTSFVAISYSYRIIKYLRFPVSDTVVILPSGVGDMFDGEVKEDQGSYCFTKSKGSLLKGEGRVGRREARKEGEAIHRAG